jgi:hypothetical protein
MRADKSPPTGNEYTLIGKVGFMKVELLVWHGTIIQDTECDFVLDEQFDAKILVSGTQQCGQEV